MKSYVIFLGGTGSMVVQSFIRLCECGYIDRPEGIKCLIIDSDEHCGNKINAVNAIREYQEMCKLFGDRDRSIFKTKILPVNRNDPDVFFLSPTETGDSSFRLDRNIFNKNEREMYNLMKMLYPDTYSDNFVNGFFGNPSAGSLVFLDWIKSNVDGSSAKFLNKMFKDIVNDSTGDEVRVFLVASIFGGTGAAGLPVLAKAINNLDGVNLENLKVGACMLLPYFGVADDEEGQRIDDDAFPSNAKKSLEFYYNQMNTGVFDRAYLIGDHTLNEKRAIYADKGAGQINWPSVMELIAASSINDFLNLNEGEFPKIVEDDDKWHKKREGKWCGVGIEAETLGAIKWSDYPDSDTFKLKLQSFERFNYMFSFRAVPLLLELNPADADDLFVKKAPQEIPVHEIKWLNNFVKQGEASFIEHTFKGIPHSTYNRWYKNPICTIAVSKIYRYLEKSAEFFFKMSNAYTKEPLCNGCAKACGVNNALSILSCVDVDCILPNLYNREPLLARACFLSFLQQSATKQHFSTFCSEVVDALFKSNNKALKVDCRTIDSMEMGGGQASSSEKAAVELALSVYATALKHSPA